MKIEEMLENLPEIKTERLTLRKFKQEDLQDVFDYGSDPEVARYALWSPFQSMEDAKKVIERYIQTYESKTGLMWGIYHNEDGKIIGSTGYIKYDIYHQKAEIGYTFARKYWGQGLATELANKLIEFGFNELNFKRIEAMCSVENVASIRVLEKTGMKEEGILRSYYQKNGTPVDVKIFSSLNNK